MPESQENFRREIGTEIKLVLEMTARVDERVKLLVEKQSEMTARLNNFIDSHNALASRVTILETNNDGQATRDLKYKYEMLWERVAKIEATTGLQQLEKMEEDVDSINHTLDEMKVNNHSISKRVEHVEEYNTSHLSRAKFVFDLFVKAAWAVVVGWMLWKLGLSNPHAP